MLFCARINIQIAYAYVIISNDSLAYTLNDLSFFFNNQASIWCCLEIHSKQWKRRMKVNDV